MTDRELLEAAAKAAGMPHKWMPVLGQMLHIIDAGHSETWNPLTDDGDALRLAVELRLEVVPVEGGGVDVVRWVNGLESIHVSESGVDMFAATRRAIVRAAAEIGQGISQPTPPAGLPEDNYYKTEAEAFGYGRAK